MNRRDFVARTAEFAVVGGLGASVSAPAAAQQGTRTLNNVVEALEQSGLTELLQDPAFMENLTSATGETLVPPDCPECGMVVAWDRYVLVVARPTDIGTPVEEMLSIETIRGKDLMDALRTLQEQGLGDAAGTLSISPNGTPRVYLQR